MHYYNDEPEVERVVRAVAREFLIAPQPPNRIAADRFSAAYLASTAARMMDALPWMVRKRTPVFATWATARLTVSGMS